MSDADSSCRRNELFRCRVMLVLAAVLWSLSGVLVKSPPLDAIPLDVRGPMLACYRALLAGILFAMFVHPRAVRWRRPLVPMVAVFTLMNVLFVSSLTRTTSAAAIFLQFTATAWVALLSVVMLKERVRRPVLAGLAGAVSGIVWIVLNEDHTHHATGNLLALGSGFSLACTLVLLRVLRDEDSTWLTALNHLGAGLLLLPWALSLDVELTLLQWLLIAALGIIQMGLPYVLFALAVRSVPVTEAVLLTLLEPVLNPIWVLIFWGEQPAVHVWTGGVLILGGLAAMTVLQRQAARRPPDQIFSSGDQSR